MSEKKEWTLEISGMTCDRARAIDETLRRVPGVAFTASLLERWGAAAPPVDRRHVERYEHIGSVELGVWDLGSQRQPATA